MSRGLPGDPFDRTPASPPSRQARRHRSTDRTLIRRAAATSAFSCPLSKRSTAWSRNRSRVVLLASVSPPPCAYLTPQGYRCRHPTVRRTPPTSPNQVQYPAEVTVLQRRTTLALARAAESTGAALAAFAAAIHCLAILTDLLHQTPSPARARARNTALEQLVVRFGESRAHLADVAKRLRQAADARSAPTVPRPAPPSLATSAATPTRSPPRATASPPAATCCGGRRGMRNPSLPTTLSPSSRCPHRTSPPTSTPSPQPRRPPRSAPYHPPPPGRRAARPECGEQGTGGHRPMGRPQSLRGAGEPAQDADECGQSSPGAAGPRGPGRPYGPACRIRPRAAPAGTVPGLRDTEFPRSFAQRARSEACPLTPTRIGDSPVDQFFHSPPRPRRLQRRRRPRPRPADSQGAPAPRRLPVPLQP